MPRPLCTMDAARAQQKQLLPLQCWRNGGRRIATKEFIHRPEVPLVCRQILHTHQNRGFVINQRPGLTYVDGGGSANYKPVPYERQCDTGGDEKGDEEALTAHGYIITVPTSSAVIGWRK